MNDIVTPGTFFSPVQSSLSALNFAHPKGLSSQGPLNILPQPSILSSVLIPSFYRCLSWYSFDALLHHNMQFARRIGSMRASLHLHKKPVVFSHFSWQPYQPRLSATLRAMPSPGGRQPLLQDFLPPGALELGPAAPSCGVFSLNEPVVCYPTFTSRDASSPFTALRPGDILYLFTNNSYPQPPPPAPQYPLYSTLNRSLCHLSSYLEDYNSIAFDSLGNKTANQDWKGPLAKSYLDFVDTTTLQQNNLFRPTLPSTSSPLEVVVFATSKTSVTFQLIMPLAVSISWWSSLLCDAHWFMSLPTGANTSADYPNLNQAISFQNTLQTITQGLYIGPDWIEQIICQPLNNTRSTPLPDWSAFSTKYQTDHVTSFRPEDNLVKFPPSLNSASSPLFLPSLAPSLSSTSQFSIDAQLAATKVANQSELSAVPFDPTNIFHCVLHPAVNPSLDNHPVAQVVPFMRSLIPAPNIATRMKQISQLIPSHDETAILASLFEPEVSTSDSHLECFDAAPNRSTAVVAAVASVATNSTSPLPPPPESFALTSFDVTSPKTSIFRPLSLNASVPEFSKSSLPSAAFFSLIVSSPWHVLAHIIKRAKAYPHPCVLSSSSRCFIDEILQPPLVQHIDNTIHKCQLYRSYPRREVNHAKLQTLFKSMEQAFTQQQENTEKRSGKKSRREKEKARHHNQPLPPPNPPPKPSQKTKESKKASKQSKTSSKASSKTSSSKASPKASSKASSKKASSKASSKASKQKTGDSTTTASSPVVQSAVSPASSAAAVPTNPMINPAAMFMQMFSSGATAATTASQTLPGSTSTTTPSVPDPNLFVQAAMTAMMASYLAQQQQQQAAAAAATAAGTGAPLPTTTPMPNPLELISQMASQFAAVSNPAPTPPKPISDAIIRMPQTNPLPRTNPLPQANPIPQPNPPHRHVKVTFANPQHQQPPPVTTAPMVLKTATPAQIAAPPRQPTQSAAAAAPAPGTTNPPQNNSPVLPPQLQQLSPHIGFSLPPLPLPHWVTDDKCYVVEGSIITLVAVESSTSAFYGNIYCFACGITLQSRTQWCRHKRESSHLFAQQQTIPLPISTLAPRGGPLPTKFKSLSKYFHAQAQSLPSPGDYPLQASRLPYCLLQDNGVLAARPIFNADWQELSRHILAKRHSIASSQIFEFLRLSADSRTQEVICLACGTSFKPTSLRNHLASDRHLGHQAAFFRSRRHPFWTRVPASFVTTFDILAFQRQIVQLNIHLSGKATDLAALDTIAPADQTTNPRLTAAATTSPAAARVASRSTGRLVDDDSADDMSDSESAKKHQAPSVQASQQPPPSRRSNNQSVTGLSSNATSNPSGVPQSYHANPPTSLPATATATAKQTAGNSTSSLYDDELDELPTTIVSSSREAAALRLRALVDEDAPGSSDSIFNKNPPQPPVIANHISNLIHRVAANPQPPPATLPAQSHRNMTTAANDHDDPFSPSITPSKQKPPPTVIQSTSGGGAFLGDLIGTHLDAYMADIPALETHAAVMVHGPNNEQQAAAVPPIANSAVAQQQVMLKTEPQIKTQVMSEDDSSGDDGNNNNNNNIPPPTAFQTRKQWIDSWMAQFSSESDDDTAAIAAAKRKGQVLNPRQKTPPAATSQHTPNVQPPQSTVVTTQPSNQPGISIPQPVQPAPTPEPSAVVQPAAKKARTDVDSSTTPMVHLAPQSSSGTSQNRLLRIIDINFGRYRVASPTQNDRQAPLRFAFPTQTSIIVLDSLSTFSRPPSTLSYISLARLHHYFFLHRRLLRVRSAPPLKMSPNHPIVTYFQHLITSSASSTTTTTAMTVSSSAVLPTEPSRGAITNTNTAAISYPTYSDISPVISTGITTPWQSFATRCLASAAKVVSSESALAMFSRSMKRLTPQTLTDYDIALQTDPITSKYARRRVVSPSLPPPVPSTRKILQNDLEQNFHDELHLAPLAQSVAALFTISEEDTSQNQAVARFRMPVAISDVAAINPQHVDFRSTHQLCVSPRYLSILPPFFSHNLTLFASRSTLPAVISTWIWTCALGSKNYHSLQMNDAEASVWHIPQMRRYASFHAWSAHIASLPAPSLTRLLSQGDNQQAASDSNNSRHTDDTQNNFDVSLMPPDAPRPCCGLGKVALISSSNHSLASIFTSLSMLPGIEQFSTASFGLAAKAAVGTAAQLVMLDAPELLHAEHWVNRTIIPFLHVQTMSPYQCYFPSTPHKSTVAPEYQLNPHDTALFNRNIPISRSTIHIISQPVDPTVTLGENTFEFVPHCVRHTNHLYLPLSTSHQSVLQSQHDIFKASPPSDRRQYGVFLVPGKPHIVQHMLARPASFRSSLPKISTQQTSTISPSHSRQSVLMTQLIDIFWHFEIDIVSLADNISFVNEMLTEFVSHLRVLDQKLTQVERSVHETETHMRLSNVARAVTQLQSQASLESDHNDIFVCDQDSKTYLSKSHITLTFLALGHAFEWSSKNMQSMAEVFISPAFNKLTMTQPYAYDTAPLSSTINIDSQHVKQQQQQQQQQPDSETPLLIKSGSATTTASRLSPEDKIDESVSSRFVRQELDCLLPLHRDYVIFMTTVLSNCLITLSNFQVGSNPRSPKAIASAQVATHSLLHIVLLLQQQFSQLIAAGLKTLLCSCDIALIHHSFTQQYPSLWHQGVFPSLFTCVQHLDAGNVPESELVPIVQLFQYEALPNILAVMASHHDNTPKLPPALSRMVLHHTSMSTTPRLDSLFYRLSSILPVVQVPDTAPVCENMPIASTTTSSSPPTPPLATSSEAVPPSSSLITTSPQATFTPIAAFNCYTNLAARGLHLFQNAIATIDKLFSQCAPLLSPTPAPSRHTRMFVPKLGLPWHLIRHSANTVAPSVASFPFLHLLSDPQSQRPFSQHDTQQTIHLLMRQVSMSILWLNLLHRMDQAHIPKSSLQSFLMMLYRHKQNTAAAAAAAANTATDDKSSIPMHELDEFLAEQIATQQTCLGAAAIFNHMTIILPSPYNINLFLEELLQIGKTNPTIFQYLQFAPLPNGAQLPLELQQLRQSASMPPFSPITITFCLFSTQMDQLYPRLMRESAPNASAFVLFPHPRQQLEYVSIDKSPLNIDLMLLHALTPAYCGAIPNTFFAFVMEDNSSLRFDGHDANVWKKIAQLQHAGLLHAAPLVPPHSILPDLISISSSRLDHYLSTQPLPQLDHSIQHTLQLIQVADQLNGQSFPFIAKLIRNLAQAFFPDVTNRFTVPELGNIVYLPSLHIALAPTSSRTDDLTSRPQTIFQVINSAVQSPSPSKQWTIGPDYDTFVIKSSFECNNNSPDVDLPVAKKADPLKDWVHSFARGYTHNVPCQNESKFVSAYRTPLPVFPFHSMVQAQPRTDSSFEPSHDFNPTTASTSQNQQNIDVAALLAQLQSVMTPEQIMQSLGLNNKK